MGDREKTGVWVWLGVTEKDFDLSRIPGKCAKCGKPTEMGYSLCRGHRSTYHAWVNEQEHPIPDDIDVKILTKAYYECPIWPHEDFSEFGLTISQLSYQLQKLRKRGYLKTRGGGRTNGGYWLTVSGVAELERRSVKLDPTLCTIKAIRDAAKAKVA